MKQVEIIVLSGFLGAGKTTLLQQLLAHEKEQGRKIGVVMNEMGNVSIDSDSVPEDTPLQELLNGCVCCTLSDKLEIKLAGLVQDHDLDAIYIETTGVAHPVDVLHASLSPMLANRLNIKSVITLLDAVTWQKRQTLNIQMRQLISEQVKHADLVLLNKTDSVSTDEQRAIEAEIRGLNPDGNIVPTTFARVDPSELTAARKKVTRDHIKLHAADQLHIKTFVYTFSKPIDEEQFESFLRHMPDSIYRIKGYLRFQEGKTLLFQYSYGMPVYQPADLKYTNTLVFIGDQLDHDALHHAMEELEQQKQA
ncbi:CobW family GTP-binding protein [Bacillus daqingensis]|uniref:CobW family GTP-binding protein n=1 Tax=Bacillus daqingensis TaxID=872396 RepID=A0ABV9NUY4_9BACI